MLKSRNDIKNREVIIKNTKSYIYHYFKWSRDNLKVKLQVYFYLCKWSFQILWNGAI